MAYEVHDLAFAAAVEGKVGEDEYVAKPGETLADLGKRTGKHWTPLRTSIANAVESTVTFQGGESVKIARLK